MAAKTRGGGYVLRHYEIMVILDGELEERTVAPSLDTYLNVIRTSGGSVEKLDVWGRRRLSYEINKKSEGIYAVIDLQASPEAVAELDRQLRLTRSTSSPASGRTASRCSCPAPSGGKRRRTLPSRSSGAPGSSSRAGCASGRTRRRKARSAPFTSSRSTRSARRCGTPRRRCRRCPVARVAVAGSVRRAVPLAVPRAAGADTPTTTRGPRPRQLPVAGATSTRNRLSNDPE